MSHEELKKEKVSEIEEASANGKYNNLSTNVSQALQLKSNSLIKEPIDNLYKKAVNQSAGGISCVIFFDSFLSR
jgi:hypothetical protein